MQFFTQIIALALAVTVVAIPAPKISQQEIDKVREFPGLGLNSGNKRRDGVR